jgi:hypothetical protein
VVTKRYTGRPAEAGWKKWEASKSFHPRYEEPDPSVIADMSNRSKFTGSLGKSQQITLHTKAVSAGQESGLDRIQRR